MNAHSPDIAATITPPIAVRAFQQAELLRLLESGEAFATKQAMAEALGRDHANMNKSLKALEADGLIQGLSVTDLGRRALLALDVAEGRAEVGAGEAADTGILHLTHDQLIPNPLNPRKSFDGIEELAESIIGAGGLLVPLIVFPPRPDGKRMLAAGERRFRAIGELIARGDWMRYQTLPCIEREEDPAQTALIALIENGQREGLNLYDEAVAYTELMAALNCSAREAARLTGKSARKVQEAVQVVRDASPEYVALYRQGLRSWEWLRGEVREAAEPPARLPPHEEMAASLREFGPASLRLPLADDGQIDIEEIAPVVQPLKEISPRETLALFEIEAACRVRPFKGRSSMTMIRTGGFGDLAALHALDAASLVKVHVSAEPHVELLPEGRRWLGSQPGAFMSDEFRLRAARVDYFLTEEKIAALESNSRFFFDWLNLTPEHKPAPKYELTDAEALLLLEIYDWTQRQAEAMRWNGGPCRADFDREVCGRLQLLGLLSFGGHTAGKGVWHMKVEPAGLAALRERFSDLDHAGKRSKAIGALHEALGVYRQPGGNGYATPWLNGPFDRDPAWLAKQAAIEAQRRAQDEAAEAAAEICRVQERRWREVKANIPTMDRQEAAEALSAYLQASALRTPWSAVGETLLSADEDDLTYGPSCGRAAEIAAMCVNLIAGIEPCDWPHHPSDDDALGQAEYLEEIAATVYKNCENGEPDVPMTIERARELAKADLAARLDRNGIAYGDPNYSWTAEDAENDAGEILTQLECGDLEGAEEAA